MEAGAAGGASSAWLCSSPPCAHAGEVSNKAINNASGK
jgi:hypothetical protein